MLGWFGGLPLFVWVLTGPGGCFEPYTLLFVLFYFDWCGWFALIFSVDGL